MYGSIVFEYLVDMKRTISDTKKKVQYIFRNLWTGKYNLIKLIFGGLPVNISF